MGAQAETKEILDVMVKNRRMYCHPKKAIASMKLKRRESADALGRNDLEGKKRALPSPSVSSWLPVSQEHLLRVSPWKVRTIGEKNSTSRSALPRTGAVLIPGQDWGSVRSIPNSKETSCPGCEVSPSPVPFLWWKQKKINSAEDANAHQGFNMCKSPFFFTWWS